MRRWRLWGSAYLGASVKGTLISHRVLYFPPQAVPSFYMEGGYLRRPSPSTKKRHLLLQKMPFVLFVL